MFKKIYTQLCAAALLFCVATTQAAHATNPEKTAFPAAKSTEESLKQLPDSSILIKEIIVSSGVKRKTLPL